MRVFRKIVAVWEDLWSVERTPAEIADMVEDFIEGRDGPWDWDDLVSVRVRDPKLDTIVRDCCGVNGAFPPGPHDNYTNPDGIEFLRRKVIELRELQKSWSR